MSVWAILQGQTMVRMARKVASGLNVPLRVQVWDPLSWWLEGASGSIRSTDIWMRFVRSDDTKAAVSCAAASPPMARHYTERYGTPSEIIISSLDPGVARLSRLLACTRRGNSQMGMAGQLL